MLLFQCPGIHIGKNVAVFPGCCRQVQDKRGVQIVQHFHAEVRPGIVAFVHNHNRLQMAQYLNQRRIRGICQKRFRVLEKFRKTIQIPVFLIDLAHVLLLAVNAQGAVAHDADRQHFPHRVRRKILPVQQHFLGVNAYAPGELLIQPLPVGMVHVREIPYRLGQDGITGHQPDHHLGLAGGQCIENSPDGGTGQKGLSAAGGHLHAHMGHFCNGIVVGRNAAQSNRHVLCKPVFPPRGEQIGTAVDAV